MDWDFPTLERWAFVLIATVMVGGPTWAAGPPVAFQIPSGPAPLTLRQFYLQSRVRVLYLANDVKGIQTQAVSGELETSQALAQMLQGTGLSYEFEGEHSAVIKRGPMVAAAPHAATTPAAPGEGPNIPAPPDTRGQTKIEEVLVTGSLIHGVFDITSPLIPVDRKEMKRTGYATVQDALRALPMAALVTRGEVIGGVGNFNRGAGINLRGLGDPATLILVNGRRQPPAGLSGDFVDVSNVPWSMVDRIEVLPDGGSALYGSDAVAGVVNILLREDMEGAETQFRYGTAADGAAELLAAQMVGHSWDTGQWFAGYQYYERTSLAATDRDYTANADKTSLGGRDFRTVSSNPGNILDPQTLQPVFAIPRGQDGTSLSPGDLLPGVVNYGNPFTDVQLLPDKQTHNLYFTASQHLSEQSELFAEGRYTQRDTSARLYISNDVRPLLLVPATNPFFVDPFGGAPFVIVAYDFTNELGPLRDQGQTRSYVGTLGLKTEFGGEWQASLSASYGAEYLRWTGNVDVNPVALGAALADPDPTTAFNPFGDGSHTNPATIEAIRSVGRRNARSEISSIQLTADGPLFDLPSGALKMAIGAEYREESLNQRSRLPGYDELIAVSNRRQFDRKIAAVFTEISVPLIGNPAAPHTHPRLELSLAGRYEQYDDFGRTNNPKIGLRWMPLSSLKLRASWGTSFKAPNFVELDDTRNVSFLVSLRDPRSPTGRSTALGIQGGNPDLREERATTWTAGFDLAPPALPGLQLSLTGYSIDYEGQVIQPGLLKPFDLLVEEDLWAAVITRNPSHSQIDAICASSHFFGDPSQCRTNPPTVFFDGRKHNLAITKVRGLDLALDQSFDTDIGRFNVQANGSYVFDFKRAFTKTAPAVDVVDTVNNPLALRLRGTVEWQQHAARETGFAVNLTANYTGGYQDRDSPLRHSVDAWTTFDLELRYQTEKHGGWMDDTELALNVANVLNDDPPFVDREFGYDYINAQPTGRVFSATVSRKW